MYAQGSKRYCKPAAVAGADFTLGDQGADLPRHFRRIGDQRARFRPWLQRPIGSVSPVGKSFGGEGMSLCPSCLLHRRSGTTHQPQGWIEGMDGRDDRGRQRAIRLRLVVECAVRLDVAQRSAFGTSDRIERTKLTGEEFPDFVRGQVLLPPTETLAVIVSWVGTDRNAISHGYHYRCSHGARVARMQSAGDVC